MCQLIVSLNDAIHRDLTQSQRLLYVQLMRGSGPGDDVLCVLAGCGPGQVAGLGPASQLQLGQLANILSDNTILMIKSVINPQKLMTKPV